MKSPADLLYEQVIQLIEPLTRFDRTSLKRESDHETQAGGEASRWYSPSFNVAPHSGGGQLPSGIQSFPSAGSAEQAASSARAAATKALPDRLRKWAERHAGDDSALTAGDCYDGSVTYGAQARCHSCGGQGKTTCGNCSGQGRTICSMCSGRGQTSCSGCGGSGQQRCGSCGGAGRMQRYVTKTVWDGYANRYHSHSETVMENCNMCGSSGRRQCGQCYGRGKQNCHSCANSGKVTCNRCGGSGSVSCSTCGASGWTHKTYKLGCSVQSRFEVDARHARPEVVARLKAFSLEHLSSLGPVEQQEPDVRANALRRRYRFTCRITELTLDTQGSAIQLVGFGERAYVFDFKNIVGVLLEQDLQTLETTVQQAPTFGVGPDEELVDAIRQCLESEANQQLGEGGPAAEKLKTTGTLSEDYAGRLTAGLRSGFRKLYLGESGLGAALAATLPAAALAAIALAGWRGKTSGPFWIALLASFLLYTGAEIFARSRVNRLFRAHMESKRMRSLLRGLGVMKKVRLTTAAVSLLLLLAALRLAALRLGM
ncbi:MAG: hypothetical protein H6509_14130 [Bryobacterales bacterium]|nr:hypothetical protein [Acidobacteriota bacterium]MCB9385750.1 hypothetical protein [Bryobacterales bacterium]